MCAVLALAAAVLTGCAQPAADPPAATGGQVPQGGAKPVSLLPESRKFPYELYTHCGIEGALIGSTYFVAETPLTDEYGNPPEGWGNPYQKGTMTLLSDTEAVFTDKLGHRVEFRVEPGVTGPEKICA
jgi:hypothetical protein